MKKKGSLDVIFFVFLTLFIAVYTIFVINQQNTKIKESFSDFDIPENWLLEKKDLEYQLYKFSEYCVLKSYLELTEKGNYFNKLGENRHYNILKSNNDKNLFLLEVEKCLNKEGELFYQNFFNNWEKKPYLSLVFSRLKNKDFFLNINENKLILKIYSFPLTEIKNKNQFKTNLSVEFSINQVGLFNPIILEEIVKCEKDEECFSDYIKNIFSVEVEDYKTLEREFFLYTFQSNREFLIDNAFRKIKFDFLVEKIN